MKRTDIYHGFTRHDDLGELATFSPANDKGREWLVSIGAEADGVYIVEAEFAPLVISCAEQRGVTVLRA